MLGVLFLRVVIDAVAKMVKVGADDYEGIIVGFLVVLAVAFNELRQAARGAASSSFPARWACDRDRHPGRCWPACWRTIMGERHGRAAGAVGHRSGVLGSDRRSRRTRGRARAAARGADGHDAMNAAPLIAIQQRLEALSRRAGAGRRVARRRAPASCRPSCGENGAGKSTLMKILSGVITDYEGEIAAARPSRSASPARATPSDAGVSIIHQELNLVEQLSAAANIFLGRELRTPLRLARRAGDGPQAPPSCWNSSSARSIPPQPVGELRVGDQQLIEIAKALSLETDILIMDEPTSALTEAEVARLFRVIERLRARGVTILYISHKMDEVFRLADRITVLRDGRLVDDARPRADRRPRGHAPDGRPRDRGDRPVGAARGRARWCWRSSTSRCPGRAMPAAGGWRTSRFRCGAARSWASPG